MNQKGISTILGLGIIALVVAAAAGAYWWMSQEEPAQNYLVEQPEEDIRLPQSEAIKNVVLVDGPITLSGTFSYGGFQTVEFFDFIVADEEVFKIPAHFRNRFSVGLAEKFYSEPDIYTQLGIEQFPDECVVRFEGKGTFVLKDFEYREPAYRDAGIISGPYAELVSIQEVSEVEPVYYTEGEANYADCPWNQKERE